MPDQTTTVRETLTDNTDAPSYGMKEPGVFVAHATLNAGTITLTLKTRMNGSGEWVTAVDANGDAITKEMSTADAHFYAELLAHGDQEFYLDPSDASSANVNTVYGSVSRSR
jgi:hypothetical protein